MNGSPRGNFWEVEIRKERGEWVSCDWVSSLCVREIGMSGDQGVSPSSSGSLSMSFLFKGIPKRIA